MGPERSVCDLHVPLPRVILPWACRSTSPLGKIALANARRAPHQDGGIDRRARVVRACGASPSPASRGRDTAATRSWGPRFRLASVIGGVLVRRINERRVRGVKRAPRSVPAVTTDRASPAAPRRLSQQTTSNLPLRGAPDTPAPDDERSPRSRVDTCPLRSRSRRCARGWSMRLQVVHSDSERGADRVDVECWLRRGAAVLLPAASCPAGAAHSKERPGTFPVDRPAHMLAAAKRRSSLGRGYVRFRRPALGTRPRAREGGAIAVTTRRSQRNRHPNEGSSECSQASGGIA